MIQTSSGSNQLFPTKTTFLTFITYISLFVSQGLLVTAVNKFNIYGFNPAIVVLLTEFTKLVICVAIHFARSKCQVRKLMIDIKINWRLILLYFVPAFLYCLYNNLTYINLELFDLTTYYCLMQFRIVLTAIIYQILFQRRLNNTQWFSLAILTLGCLIKEFGVFQTMSKLQLVNYQISSLNETTIYNDHTLNAANQTSAQPYHNQASEASTHPNRLLEFLYLTYLLVLQMFCSCFAGVYNEYLLKDSSTAKNADVILQNIFMYLDSIVCNTAFYALIPNQSKNANQREPVELSVVFRNLLTSPLVLTLILNNALSGLVASFFLKSLNSILKTFASALELFAVAFFAWVLFGHSIDMYTVVALILVSSALSLYSRSPVSAAPPEKDIQDREGFMLLPTTEEDELS